MGEASLMSALALFFPLFPVLIVLPGRNEAVGAAQYLTRISAEEGLLTQVMADRCLILSGDGDVEVRL
jgi:hypothetical protein